MVSKFQDKKRLKKKPTKDELLEYYTEHGNLELLTREERINISSGEYVTGCFNNTCFRCRDKNCEFCKEQFPGDKDVQHKYEVKESHKTGQGLFTTCDIEPGAIICQYKGRKVYGNRDKVKGNYVAMLVKGVYLNAETTNCLAKNINHSCDSNCKLQKVTLINNYAESTRRRNGRISRDEEEALITELWVVAKKRIKKSEEITFDYGEDSKSFFPDGCCCCSHCLDQPRRALRKSERRNGTKK